MIVNLSQRYVSVAAEEARSTGSGVCVVADRQSSTNTLNQKVKAAVNDSRLALVNWRWYRPADQTPEWFEAFAGATRGNIEAAEATRRQFFEFLGDQFPNGPLLAPTGPVNDPARSLSYVREMVGVRDSAFTGREVYASLAVDKQGLQDPAVLSLITPPVGVSGIFLTVLDSTAYPSTWTESEWLAWLRLVGSLQLAGLSVVLDCADLRGLVALGLVDLQYSTGTGYGDRQAPLDPSGGGGAGATAPVAYFSAPLLSVMHGENLAVEPTGRDAAENHAGCGVFGGLPFPAAGSDFDADWMVPGGGVGVQTTRRFERHFHDLHSVETWLRAQSNRVDAMETLLVHAESAGSPVSPHLFKTPGSRGELASRLAAFRAARAALAL